MRVYGQVSGADRTFRLDWRLRCSFDETVAIVEHANTAVVSLAFRTGAAAPPAVRSCFRLVHAKAPIAARSATVAVPYRALEAPADS